MGLTVMDRKKDGTPKPRNRCRYWKITVDLKPERDTSKVLDEAGLGADASPDGTQNGTRTLPSTPKRKRRTKSEYFRGTEKEARIREAELKVELNRCDSTDIELEPFARAWLERKRPRIENTTYMNTLAMVNTLARIFPSTRIQDLDDEAIQDAFTGFKHSRAGEPFSDTYIGNLVATLEQILKHAVRANIIQHVPTEYMEKPSRRNRKEPVAPTIEEMRELISKLDVRDRNECCVFLSATMGLRVGEALGCKWKDIDFDEQTLHVQRNMRHDGVLADTVKTASSKRLLPMTDFITAALQVRKHHLTEQLREFVTSLDGRSRRMRELVRMVSGSANGSDDGDPMMRPDDAIRAITEMRVDHLEDLDAFADGPTDTADSPALPSGSVDTSCADQTSEDATHADDMVEAIVAMLIEESPVCAKVDGEPTSTSSQSHWWRKNRERLGMTGYTQHSLRHGYLSALAAVGRTPTEMMKLAGHSTAQITLEIYTHINMREKVDAVESLVSKLYPERFSDMPSTLANCA